MRNAAGRLLRFCLPFALAAAGFLAAADALAHAVLLGTVPADRAAVERAPGEVELRFGEPVTPVLVRVIDPAGRTVVGPDGATADGGTVRLPLPAGLPSGRYLVTWRVTSADSHAVTGAIQFAVGPTPVGWPEDITLAARADDGAASAAWLAVANRALHLAALAVAAGGALFVLLVDSLATRRRPGLRVLLCAAAAVAALTADFAIGLQGAVLRGEGTSALLSAEAWRVGVASTRGTASLAALAAAALLLAGVCRMPRRGYRPLLGIGAGLAVAGFLLSGHAATASPGWLSKPAVLVHVAVALFWLGSLPPLLAVARTEPGTAAGKIGRFSSLAVVGVPVMLGAGVLLAVLQIGEPAALFAGTYATVLAVKLALVAVLLGLAAWNRLRLTPALRRRGGAGAAFRLRRSIAAEIVVGALVLAVTALLSQTPPPRTAMAAAVATAPAGPPEPRMYAVANPRGLALLGIAAAGPAGDARISVGLVRPDGAPLTARELELELAHPASGVAGLRRTLRPGADGRFLHQGPELALPGRWVLRLEALVDDFDRTVFETEVVVP